MVDDIRRFAANLFGMAAVIGAALLIVFGMKHVQLAVDGPIYTPTRRNVPVALEPTSPRPTPTPTSTPRAPVWTASGILVEPTATPYWNPVDPAGDAPDEVEVIVETVIDLAEGRPDEEVYVYVVWSTPATYTQYLVPKEQVRTTELRRLLDLAPADQIIQAYHLVGLPQRRRFAANLSVALVASETHCIKFDLALCDRLTTLGPDDRVDVAIWLRDINYPLVYDIIAPVYPDIQPQRHRPFDPSHPAYESAFVAVETLIGQGYRQRAAPLIYFLRASGIEDYQYSPWAPVVTATLSPDTILALADWSDVVNINLIVADP